MLVKFYGFLGCQGFVTKVADNYFMKQFAKAHLTALWSVPGIGYQSFQRCLLIQKKTRISDEGFWSNQDQIWQKSMLSKKQAESIIKFKKDPPLQ